MSDSAWNGECHVADVWVAFRGRAGDNRSHAHAAVQVCVGLGSPVCVTSPAPGGGDVRTVGTAVLVRPGTRHQLQPCARALVLLVEPQSPLARRLLHATSDGRGVVVASPETTAGLGLRGPLSALCDGLRSPRPHRVDARLKAALGFLADAPLRNAVSSAAAHCGLSEPRLRAIASEQLGVPLSKWVGWQALRRAADELRAGVSIAAAAAAGGFADQAHFTRALGQTIGVTPGTLAAALRPSRDGGSGR